MNSVNHLYNYFYEFSKFPQNFENKIVYGLSNLTLFDEERLADKINSNSLTSKKRWENKFNEEFFSKIKFILIIENIWHEWFKHFKEKGKILLSLTKYAIFDPYIWLGGIMTIQKRRHALELQLALELEEKLPRKKEKIGNRNCHICLECKEHH